MFGVDGEVQPGSAIKPLALICLILISLHLEPTIWFITSFRTLMISRNSHTPISHTYISIKSYSPPWLIGVEMGEGEVHWTLSRTIDSIIFLPFKRTPTLFLPLYAEGLHFLLLQKFWNLIFRLLLYQWDLIIHPQTLVDEPLSTLGGFGLSMLGFDGWFGLRDVRRWLLVALWMMHVGSHFLFPRQITRMELIPMA